MNRLKPHVVLFSIIICAPLLQSAPFQRADEDGVHIALLSPHDGASLNASTLHVQALIAAYRAARNATFMFNGQTVPGLNAGRIAKVEVALDGKLVQTLDTRCWGAQLVADFRVDLTHTPSGPHSVNVAAFRDKDDTPASVSAAFNLDPTLPAPETNRIEEAATPQVFAGFSIGGDEGNCGEGGDDDLDWPWHPAKELHGQFVLGHLSDGVDFTQDRVVVALGAQTQTIEPGKIHCEKHGSHESCTFEDRSALPIQKAEFSRKQDALWDFQLQSAQVQGASNFYLRIGNDWGGIDLRTGERLAGLRSELDLTHQAQFVIGSKGGQIQTTDASGILIRLAVPPGALTTDTLIKLTPLTLSPLPNSSAVSQTGVQFEPDGLHFAQPALLTLDFSASRQSVSAGSSIFLLTSPLTTLPLFGSVNPAAKTITAFLYHFSTTDAGVTPSEYVDVVAWGTPILKAAGLASFSELQSEIALLERQQLDPTLCVKQNCLDLNAVEAKAQASLSALANQACTDGTAEPSTAKLDRMLTLDDMAKFFQVQLQDTACEHQILKTLIDADALVALNDPKTVYVDPTSDLTDPTLITLQASADNAHQTLLDYADHLGFPDLVDLCRTDLAAAIRTRINRTGDLADSSALDQDLHLARLEELQHIAELTGLSELAALALQRLDQAIKNQASRDVAQAQQLGTDAANQTAIADLQHEITVAAGDPALNQLDPQLQTVLQQDINKLKAPPAKFVLRSTLEEGECCNIEQSTWVFAHPPIGVRGPGSFVYAADGSTPPLTLIDSDTAATITSTWSQPDRNTLAWSVTGQGNVNAHLYVELTIPIKGVLHIDSFAEAFTPPTLQTFIYVTWRPLTPGAIVDGSCSYQPNTLAPCLGGLPVNPGKIGLAIQLGGTGYVVPGNGVPIDLVGSINGRVATVTFTPSP